MRTYIGPIGFNPTSITRPILSHGLDHGDAVVLIRPQEESDDRRAEETLADIDRNLGALEPDVTITVERVPHDEFDTALLGCQRIIREAEPNRILIAGGGARDVLVPLTIAAVSMIDSIELVLGYSDVDHAVRELAVPKLTTQVTDSAMATLSAIEAESSLSLPELSEECDHAKSTITRHINQLEEAGLVDTWREGRTKQLRLTVSGKLRHPDHS